MRHDAGLEFQPHSHTSGWDFKRLLRAISEPTEVTRAAWLSKRHCDLINGSVRVYCPNAAPLNNERYAYAAKARVMAVQVPSRSDLTIMRPFHIDRRS